MQIVYTTSNYKIAVYRAVLAVILGAILILWPETALRYIIMIIGIVFIATGLISFILANRHRAAARWSAAPFSGIGSLAFGVLLLAWPSFFVSIFMFLLGFILLLAAVGQFVALSAARRMGHVSPFNWIFPVLIFVAGMLVLFDPFQSARSVLILSGATAIFYGLTDLVNQYRIRKIRRAAEEQEHIRKLNREEDIQDVDYEEVK